MNHRLALSILGVFFVMAAGHMVATAAEQGGGVPVGDTASEAAGGPYTVNPGDVLGVSVWREQDLQLQVIVRPDGYFSFPLTGDVRAEGATVAQIQSDVTAKIGRFIPDPVVNVAVLEPRGNKVYVIGQVARPGEFPVTRYVDVVQALSMAGGTTPFAQLGDIKILRREGPTLVAIPFAYGDIAAGRRLQQNILLRPGDTVVVP